jgi:hypothetical protein
MFASYRGRRGMRTVLPLHRGQLSRQAGHSQCTVLISRKDQLSRQVRHAQLYLLCTVASYRGRPGMRSGRNTEQRGEPAGQPSGSRGRSVHSCRIPAVDRYLNIYRQTYLCRDCRIYQIHRNVFQEPYKL